MTTGHAAPGHRRLRVGACLSLSGRLARFGRQAARGLDVWRSLDGSADLIVEDDRSDPPTLEDVLPRVAARCDVLLGPYSTRLTREAGRLAAGAGWLLWNHGGSGDDVESAYPGHIVSVLAPRQAGMRSLSSAIWPPYRTAPGHETVLVRWTAAGPVPAWAGDRCVHRHP